MAEMQRKEIGGLKELAILVGILLTVVAGAIGTYWVHSQGVEAAPGTSKPAETATGPRAVIPAPPAGVFHADVYFDFKSTRLRADAARLLQEKAALVTAGEPWAVLIQGHADQRGDATYNRLLAQRRADAVKQFLVELGVPEPSIKAATLGQDNAVCDDPGAACQQLNRRVHLEFRRLPRMSGLPVEPARAQIAAADELDTDADAECGVDADDEEADWSVTSSFAK